ncbi:nuclear transport factor 2 family protein [Actinoplanes sp. TBRC 11911]|uniref:ester cyclase n=1 Tax=Actinoplanes sp. TBRC 11911 TaxID=2729386 RepID=UPI00145F43F1|nr:nuclear transport factor 2 family protein [Actinoplanes sp. TBRC 11911]NMO55351.1 nuclear transport factor 2 family protein [Actinoplanes sp. TBRC 11911]
MSFDNEQLIRHLYKVAEDQGGIAFAECFSPEGVFTDMATGRVSRGYDELTKSLEPILETFPDMRRELNNVYVAGDTVIVELTLIATHKGPLPMPGGGVIPPTGIKTETPCCDVFQLKAGKVEVFNCYPEVVVTLAQLGVLSGLGTAVGGDDQGKLV